MRTVVSALLVLLALVFAAACGGDDESSEGSPPSEATTVEQQLKIAWLMYGAKNDGGWNLTNYAGYPAIQEKYGDAIEQVETDNVPYTEEASQITQRFIDEGANVIFDTVGLAELATDVCEENPDVKCVTTVPVGELPDNTTGFWTSHWIPAYTAGVAGGLVTKTNTLGFVSGYDIPLIKASINAFTMGCRSVNPDCQVRVIHINEYFSPPKTEQAANTLVDTGVDVLRGYTDDPSYCRVGEQRGVFVLPEFQDASAQCPTWILTSTVWDFSSYYLNQVEDILAGTWEPVDLEFIPPDEVFSLGTWGPMVPDGVQEQVEETFEQLKSGELNPFVGPLTDRSGKVRVQDGEELSDEFLYSGWEWYVEGVITGS